MGVIEIEAKNIVEFCKEKKYSVATAESCTGGLLASAFIDVPGASSAFAAGFVTYATTSKIDILGVDPKTVERFGVVSEQVALEMACNAAKKGNAHIGISTTGVAGPDGGTKKTPIGTVCIGVWFNGIAKTRTVCLENADRGSVRKFGVDKALEFVLEIINSK